MGKPTSTQLFLAFLLSKLPRLRQSTQKLKLSLKLSKRDLNRRTINRSKRLELRLRRKLELPLTRPRQNILKMWQMPLLARQRRLWMMRQMQLRPWWPTKLHVGQILTNVVKNATRHARRKSVKSGVGVGGAKSLYSADLS